MKCWCGCNSFEETFHLEYAKCEVCGTYVSRKKTPDDYYDFQKYWHDLQTRKYGFPAIEERAKSDFSDRIPFWWDVVKLHEPKTVLEVGCGHGGFLHFCRCKGIEHVIGIEMSQGTCDFAKDKFNVDVYCGDFMDLLIKGNFDLVCAFDVLEHLKNPLEGLLKMKSLGKTIVIQTPCYRDEGRHFLHFNGDEHLFIFTQKSINDLFKKAGLKIFEQYRGAFSQDITIVGVSNEV